MSDYGYSYTQLQAWAPFAAALRLRDAVEDVKLKLDAAQIAEWVARSEGEQRALHERISMLETQLAERQPGRCCR